MAHDQGDRPMGWALTSSHPVDELVCWEATVPSPSGRLRPFLSAVVLAVGAVATAASNGPLFGPAVSAEDGPFYLVLTPDAPDAEVSFSALLDTQDEIVAGSGEVAVSVELDPASTASLSFGLTPDLLTYPFGKLSAFSSNLGFSNRKPEP